MKILVDEEVFQEGVTLPLEHASELESEEGSWEESEYNYRLQTCDTKIYAVIDNVVVGHLGIQEETVRAVYVDSKHRGEGIATKLYLHAFQLLEHLYSDDAREEGATRIWERFLEKDPEHVRYLPKRKQYEYSKKGF